MPPRIAESFATRVKRASPCPSRNPSSSSCRSTARATSATRDQHERAQHQAQPRAELLLRETALCSLRIIATCDQCSWVTVVGFTMRTSSGRGITMRRPTRAVCSTRPCVAQALCSSFSWPHSISSASRSRVQALQLDEQAARLVLASTRRRSPAASTSATTATAMQRIAMLMRPPSRRRACTALRARGLAATSSADG